ncbi:MAG: hypothetical protein CSA19_01085 [Deltaproteobacteria bacterium]|nr:MAG: hypothetical protein CSA19_01085 [Deltaproteobacteria bacterium]
MNQTSFILSNAFKPLFVSFALALLLRFLGFSLLSNIALAFFGLALIFYRNPEREPEESDAFSIIAPIDGKVEQITPTNDSTIVEISSFLTDAHIVRAPLQSHFEYTKRSGINLFRKHPLHKKLGTILQFSFTKDEHRLSLELVEGFVRSQTAFFAQSGFAQAGARMAFFNTSVARLILPKNVELHVCTGDNLRAGESLVGFIK